MNVIIIMILEAGILIGIACYLLDEKDKEQYKNIADYSGTIEMLRDKIRFIEKEKNDSEKELRKQEKQMTFDEMYLDLINRVNGYKISHQQSFGLLATVKEQIAAHMAESLKDKAVNESWNQAVKEYTPHTPDLPLVETTEG